MRTEVLIIGGGATGAGIARDLSLRGVKVLLLEKGDFCVGASGGNHGMLHSGARYAVKDPESARECASESEVLRRIAPECIEDTGGLFVRLEHDDPSYTEKFVRGCQDNGVALEHLTKAELMSAEPAISPDAIEGYGVRDGSIDPFRLVLDNIGSARELGSEIRNYSPVTGVVKEDGLVTKVDYKDLRTGKTESVSPEIVINAAGAWADEIARLAGCELRISRDYGTLLVVNGRSVNKLVNRLRSPSDGDIIVPNHTSMIIGTTSRKVNGIEDARPTRDEVTMLHREATALVPSIGSSRIMRAYGGTRPLAGDSGRDSSRTYRIIDHSREGAENLLSIFGGKLTTYRLMAEAVSDIACRMLGINASCRTDRGPLTDHDHYMEPPQLPVLLGSSIVRRYGGFPRDMPPSSWDTTATAQSCSCEQVARFELDHYAKDPDVMRLTDMMRRTRAGMGFCQGTACLCEMMAALSVRRDIDPIEALEDFLTERRKSLEAILEGDQMRQEIFRSHLLRSIMKGGGPR